MTSGWDPDRAPPEHRVRTTVRDDRVTVRPRRPGRIALRVVSIAAGIAVLATVVLPSIRPIDLGPPTPLFLGLVGLVLLVPAVVPGRSEGVTVRSGWVHVAGPDGHDEGIHGKRVATVAVDRIAAGTAPDGARWRVALRLLDGRHIGLLETGDHGRAVALRDAAERALSRPRDRPSDA